jgi:hypothetical protein
MTDSLIEWLDSLPEPDWLREMKDKPLEMTVKRKVGKRWITETKPAVDYRALFQGTKGDEDMRTPTPKGANPKGRGVKLPDQLDQQQLRAQQKLVDTILAPLNRVATELEEKWGLDRLPSLVDEELAARFASAAQKLEEAVASKDQERIKERAEIMRRGWLKLDEAAETAGHESYKQLDVWEGRRPDGKTFLVAKDQATAVAANRDKGLGVWTLDEIGRLLEHFDKGGLTQALKEEFGGELVSINAKEPGF